MKMTSIRKGNMIGALIFLGLIICLVISYDNNIKNPYDSPSPGASGKLFYFFLFFLDKYLGKFGVFTFFGVCFLFFLYNSFKWKSEK